MPVRANGEVIARRGATARRGDAAAGRISRATARKTSGRLQGPRAALATARRGDAAAARGSVQPRGRPGADGLGAAVTAGCSTTAQRGNAAAARGLLQPWGRPRGGGEDGAPRRCSPWGRRSGGEEVGAAT